MYGLEGGAAPRAAAALHERQRRERESARSTRNERGLRGRRASLVCRDMRCLQRPLDFKPADVQACVQACAGVEKQMHALRSATVGHFNCVIN